MRQLYKIDLKIISRDIPIPKTYDIMFASVQEFVKNIRRGSMSSMPSESVREVREGRSPKSSPKSSPDSKPPSPIKSDTSTCDTTTRQAYLQRIVLDDIHHSLSRHTRHRNIGDDMNETWIFENPSVNLGASNCRVCGEYIMTSNYDFYVDTLPNKCMCKCDH